MRKLIHNKSKFLLFFIILCFPYYSLQAQDKIHKADSSIIEVKVIEINAAEIKYKKFTNQSGPLYSISKSKVLMIEYENGEKEVYNTPKVKQTTPVTNTPATIQEKTTKRSKYRK